MIEDRFGLDARHDPGAGQRERQWSLGDRITLEQTAEEVLDDLHTEVRIATDHPVEVAQIEMTTTDAEIHGTEQFDFTIIDLLADDPQDMFTERFRFTRQMCRNSETSGK